MIHMIGLVLIGLHGDTPLKVKDVLSVPEAQLLKNVGPRDMATRREFGIAYIHKGFNKVWVDAGGAKMKQARFNSERLMPWKQYLGELGLDGSHASSHPESVPPSPLPMLRNKLSLTGVTGFPAGAGHKSWSITYVEYAIANKKRLRDLKAQITAQPVGEGRNKLIRSCYDWFSELDFSSS